MSRCRYQDLIQLISSTLVLAVIRLFVVRAEKIFRNTDATLFSIQKNWLFWKRK